ncbi:hypothetical protein [Serratia odorifera]|uniref:hypothetical protein n=1 Tax=Serratia odorifera TaxID=618 RepID=UPI0013E3CF6B|nr:hypothetical protein [Serratia odorifera]
MSDRVQTTGIDIAHSAASLLLPQRQQFDCDQGNTGETATENRKYHQRINAKKTALLID